MNQQLKYVPIFRGLQEEFKILKTFDFGEHMYPCVEIIKEVDHKVRQPKEGSGKPKKPEKTFEESYLPLIERIKSKNVFIDLPVQLKQNEDMNEDSLLFLRTVVTVRDKRTEYILKLASLKDFIIPVISTYSQITGERGSIKLQEQALRPTFATLAFRTFMDTFSTDIEYIKELARPCDYVLMDWNNNDLDNTEGDQEDIVKELKKIKCTVIFHRNPIPKEVTNVSLVNDEVVEKIDNTHIEKYQLFGGHCFSDYAGIKKNMLSGAPIISPGFLYYDAIQNNFYGYRYLHGSNKKGEVKPSTEEFETTIVPAIFKSKATERMLAHPNIYLTRDNNGYITLRNIQRGSGPASESGKSAAKFKKIGMEHYLYCMKVKIGLTYTMLQP
jgi:Beta protein